MTKKRILIIGAGLAGLSTAWHLKRKGIDSLVFEKASDVGGLCRSKSMDGFTFDCDGHLLHFKHRYTYNLIKHLLAGNLLEHQRSAWIYTRDSYIRYPFQANLYGLPTPVVKECLLGYISAHANGQLKREKNQNFFDWVKHTFGPGMARHFFIPYNTKFWTLRLQRLTCEWLGEFIPIPSLSQIIEGTIEESQRQFGYNARFWYPKRGGIHEVSRSFASQLKHIFTGCAVIQIDLARKEIQLSSGERERFDYLICTLPLPEMEHMVKGFEPQVRMLFKKLKWNSIFNLNLGIDKKDHLKRHWVYFPERRFSFFRVGFFHNFSPYLAPQNKSSLYVEVSYSKNRPIDKNSIIQQIKEDLCKAGVITAQDTIVAQDIDDIGYGYPIYDSNYSAVRERLVRALLKHHIIPCGRYGSWRYMSMEDAILDGKDVAQKRLSQLS